MFSKLIVLTLIFIQTKSENVLNRKIPNVTLNPYVNKRAHYIKALSIPAPNQYSIDSYPRVFDTTDHKYSTCDPRIDLTRLPGSCNSFRRCVKGVLFLIGCPYGTVFDEKIKVCNFPDNIKGPCSYSDGCSPDIDLTSVPGYNDRFFRCTNGILYILKCPNTLIFSNREKSCTNKIRYYS